MNSDLLTKTCYYENEKILLLRRKNTGFFDGSYSVIAGHIDETETATHAIEREAMEEAGITVDNDSLRLVHTMHRKSTEERIDLFFTRTLTYFF